MGDATQGDPQLLAVDSLAISLVGTSLRGVRVGAKHVQNNRKYLNTRYDCLILGCVDSSFHFFG